MTQTSPIFNRTIAGMLLSSALVLDTANAEVVSHSKDTVIKQPAGLSEPAQHPGIAFEPIPAA
jgi:hypothetical protein